MEQWILGRMCGSPTSHRGLGADRSGMERHRARAKSRATSLSKSGGVETKVLAKLKSESGQGKVGSAQPGKNIVQVSLVTLRSSVLSYKMGAIRPSIEGAIVGSTEPCLRECQPLEVNSGPAKKDQGPAPQPEDARSKSSCPQDLKLQGTVAWIGWITSPPL